MSSGNASVASYAGAKLYYTPKSCGAASFIAAYTAGLKGLELEQIDLKTHITQSGKDFYSINPKGNVPTLVLGDGTVLNEGSAILQFIADQKPTARLAAPWGSVERYRLQNALNHIATEVHQRFSAVLRLQPQDVARESAIQRSTDKLQWLDKELKDKGNFYVSDHFTVADAYLYVVLTWIPWFGLTLDNYPHLKKYFEGIKTLPNVQEAYKLMDANPSKVE